MAEIVRFKTDNFVDAVRPFEHCVHYLSCKIDEKGGKIGSHAVYLILYPARIVDRTIQLAITPLVCVFGNIFEAFAIPYRNPNESYLKHLFTLPLRLPFYLLGNVIQRCAQLAVAILPLATIYGLALGSDVGKYFFTRELDRIEGLEDYTALSGNKIISPHLPNLPINQNFTMKSASFIKLRETKNHRDTSIKLFF